MLSSRCYTLEEKQAAVELGERVGAYVAARELGIPANTIKRWAAAGDRLTASPGPLPPVTCVDCGKRLSRRGSTRCRKHALEHLRGGTRDERLEEIQRQVAEGTLIIRPMTAAEREMWGPPKTPNGKVAKVKRQRSLAVAGTTTADYVLVDDDNETEEAA